MSDFLRWTNKCAVASGLVFPSQRITLLEKCNVGTQPECNNCCVPALTCWYWEYLIGSFSNTSYVWDSRLSMSGCMGKVENKTEHHHTLNWSSPHQFVAPLLHHGDISNINHSVSQWTHTSSPGAETAGSLRSLWQRARKNWEQGGSGWGIPDTADRIWSLSQSGDWFLWKWTGSPTTKRNTHL